MLREIIAIVLLMAILAALIVNLNVLDAKAQSLYEQIDAAQGLANSGKSDEAAEIASAAAGEWLDWGNYSHIFLRYSETQDVSQSFFELIKSIRSAEGADAADFDSLRERLRRLIDNERPTLDAVF